MKKGDKIKLDQLFKEMKQGNAQMIQEIYNRYHRLVYGIAFSILKNKEDAEDVMQIVFSKLYSIDKSKLPKEKAGTWLYSVTKNEALAILRRKGEYVSLEDIYNCENTRNEIDSFIDKESYNKLINKLSQKEQEIVSLKILSKLTFQEIAEMLGESENTIKWRYYKAIYTLRITLSNLGMFIITFVLGIVTLKNQKKEAEDTNKVSDEIEIQPSEPVYRDDEESTSKVEEMENTEFIENVIVEYPTSNTTNYVSTGIFGISAIFLILTIIFSLSLAKYQLNKRKKWFE